MAKTNQAFGSDPKGDIWPNIPLETWQDTCATLHMWTQIIGKIRLEQAPMINHWWQVAFYVTSYGLTTSPIPFGSLIFQIDLDFLVHEMRITSASGDTRSVPLVPRSVSDFYRETMNTLKSMGLDIAIWTTPVEVPDRTPFEEDHKHASYDPEHAQRFWKALLQIDRVFKKFRSLFIGKVSPVHFFWGAFDMAVTRFSGRLAPEHPGVPNVARSVMVEAYSHEVSSCGFWPGTGLGKPAFYAYAYPEPKGFKDYSVQPEEASYNKDVGEFILYYDAVRTAQSPDEKLLSFLESTYEAAAITGTWDRASLERTGRKT